MNYVERLGLLRLETDEKGHGRLSLQSSTSGDYEDGDCPTTKGCLTALM